MKVSELIQQPGQWNDGLIQQCYLSPDSHLILTIPLSPFDHRDSWFWHYSKNGSYSVRSGYNLALNATGGGPSSSSDALSSWWRAFWSNRIPRKIIIFGWRGFHEILPTTKGLFRRNITTHSNCPLCGFGEDSNAHAVFWCPFAQEVWLMFDYTFVKERKENISFKDVLLYATEILEKEEFGKMLIIAWGIWTERNKITHEQQHRSPQQIKIWLSMYYEEIRNASGLERGVLAREEVTQEEQIVVGANDLILFVDASISTSTEMIGLGAVIFAADRKVQASLSKPLEGTLSVIHAEALALLVGLHWVQTIGIPIKVVFSDSLSLVQALNHSSEYQNELGVLFSDIKNLLTEFPGISVSHVNRNCNTVAHNLAKHALQLESETVWMEEMVQNEENHD